MKVIASLSLLAAVAAGTTGAPAPAADVPAAIDLSTALQLALEHNTAIRQARAAYRQNSGAVTTAESGAWPTVTASGSYTRIDQGLIESANGFRFGSDTTWQVGVQAQQTLYSGGAVSAAVRASRLSRDAAAAAYAETVQTALLQVRINYYAVLLAREQVGVQEQNIQLLEEELTNSRARVRAGSGSPFDELRAEVALANGQPGLIRARNAYRVAAVDLLRSIGLPSEENTADQVTGELGYEPHEIGLEAALDSAHANRPELQRLEKLVAAAEASVDTARAAGRPVVAAVGGYRLQKSQFSGSGSDTVDGWTVGLQSSWDIFDGRATRGRVEQARAALDQARLTLADARLAIDADVRRSYASFRDAIELVTSTRRVVEQAEESLRLARSRFSAGAATQLDVLTAQVALTDARSNVAQALHDVTVAYAYLERSAALAPLPAGTPDVTAQE